MRSTSRRQHTAGDSGAGTIEYLGVIVVVVGVVGSIILAGTPIGQTIAASLCKAVGADCAAVTSAQRSPADYVPPEPCVISSHGGENKANISFMVTLEGGEKWLIEQLSDGRYRLTHQGGGGASAHAGAGGGMSVTTDNVAAVGMAEASIGAGLGLNVGGTYYADSAEEAENLLFQRREGAAKDAVFGRDNPLRSGVDWLTSHLGDDPAGEQQVPDEWFVEGGAFADASATGVGGLPGLTGALSAEGSASRYVGRTERGDGTSTDYLRTEGKIDLGATETTPALSGSGRFSSIAVGAGGESDSLVEIDRDSDGNPVAMRVVSTMGGHTENAQWDGIGGLADSSSMTAITTQIPLETDSDKQVASRMLQTLGVVYAPGITDPTEIGQAAWTPSQFADLMAAWEGLAMTRGYIWQQDFTASESTDYAAQVDAEMGAVTGAGVSSVSNVTQTTGYRYWDGSQWVTREGCTQ